MTRIAYVAAGAAAVAASVFFGLELSGGSHLTSVLGAALVFWVALFAVHPAIGLLTLIVVRPLVDVYVHHTIVWRSLSLSLGTAWGVLTIATLLVFIARRPPRLREIRSFAIPLMFVAAYALLSFGRPGSHTAMAAGSRVFTAILLVLAIQQIARTARGQALVVTGMCAFAATCVVAVGIELMTNTYGSGYYNHGAFDWTSNQAPYAFAVFAVLLIPFLSGAVASGAPRVLPLTLAFLLIAAVVFSFSRTAYAALALVLLGVLVAVVRQRTTLGFRRAPLLAVAAAVALVLAAVSVFFRHQIADRFTHGGIRVPIWDELLHSLASQPRLLVIGGGAAYSAAGHFRILPHNDFLEVLATGGIVLAPFFIAFLAWLGFPLVRLAFVKEQTDASRNFGIVCLSAFAAFVLIAILDGIVFNVMSLVAAVLVGLARGMATTPGASFIDERVFSPELELDSPQARGRVAEDRARQPHSWRWATLGLAALAIVILTSLGGFAIYTWGWRGHRVGVTRETVAHESGQTARTVTGARGGSQSPSSRRKRFGDPATLRAALRLQQRAFAVERMRRYGISVPAGLDPLTYYRLVGSKQATAAQRRRQRTFALARMSRYGILVPAGVDPLTYFRFVGSKLVASALPLKHRGTLVVSAWWLTRLLSGPRSPGGEPTGFDADLINRIAAFYAVPRVKWVDAYRAPLAARSADFEVNDLVDKDSANYRYSTPFLANNLGLLVRTSSRAAATRRLSTVAKLRIGVPDVETGASVEKTVRPQAAPRVFSSYGGALSALQNGEVDAVFMFLPVGSAFAGNGLEFTAQVATGLQYAFRVSIDSPMLPSLNRALEEMRASGTLSELVKTWFPETIDLPVLKR